MSNDKKADIKVGHLLISFRLKTFLIINYTNFTPETSKYKSYFIYPFASVWLNVTTKFKQKWGNESSRKHKKIFQKVYQARAFEIFTIGNDNSNVISALDTRLRQSGEHSCSNLKQDQLLKKSLKKNRDNKSNYLLKNKTL